MSRLWSSGFELNSGSIEWDNGISTFTIQTAIVRSGTYAMKKSASSTNASADQSFASVNQTAAFYFRAYFYFTAFPAAATGIMKVLETGFNDKVGLKVTSAGKIQLFDLQHATQVGSDSAALSLNQWYRLEMKVDTTTLASTAVDARIDGVSFASGTINITNGIYLLRLSMDSSDATIQFYVDDVAINDATGSFQNSWPGTGSIVHLHPNAAGDNTGWGGGTAGSEFNQVNEVPPDDSTTVRFSHTAATDDFNIDNTPAAIDSAATINCVQVGFRIAVDNSGGTQGIVQPRLKASSGGTVSTGTSITITHDATQWQTNADSTPRKYPLTSYQQPGTANAWTKATLDTAQIGVALTNNPTNTPRYTNVWLLVEYAPSSFTWQQLSSPEQPLQERWEVVGY